MPATEEQLAIEYLTPRGITQVRAFAGTGKTTSLVQLAKRQSILGKRCVYLTYTKSAQLDAERRFGRAALCKTINGLAYPVTGVRYKHKLADLNLRAISNALGLGYDWHTARAVSDTVEYFCCSDLLEFPLLAMRLNGPVNLSVAVSARVAELAHSLWQMMVDPSNAISMTHAGYLKLFHLERCQIACDYLLLDEAQDSNPVTLAIILGQRCPVVLVGDQYQSIFAFRGAENAFATIAPDQVLPLTQSFRFGPKVAAVANSLLWGFFGETTEVIGSGPDTTVLRSCADMGSDQHAILARSNSELFSRAIIHAQANAKLGFVGGVASYNFSKIVDAWHLCANEHHLIRDQFIREFPSFTELDEYARDAGDVELNRMVGLVHAYGQSISDLIDLIHARSLGHLAQADVVLSTAHRSKGLTLDHVELADDFPEIIDDVGYPLQPEVLSRQEIHLLYVAATRASKSLTLNSALHDFLRATHAQIDIWDKPKALPVDLAKSISNPVSPVLTGAPLPWHDSSPLPTASRAMPNAAVAQAARRRNLHSQQHQSNVGRAQPELF